ncbi:Polycystin cation channel, PKD1/PKD2 [Phytophthora cactorum]|nr:Polycystin cation channel, PKD1/PKD2 [Phytophthora cactorum]
MAVKDAITALEFDYYVLGVALFRLFTTVGFCVIFAILVNSGTPNEQMYTQSNAVSTKLAPVTSSPFHSDTTVQFYDIDSVDDIYDWLTDTFIPTVFVMTDHTGKALPEHQLGHLDLANRVLGGVILDMTPREYESCDKEFVLLELYPMCTYVDYPGTAKAAIATLKQGGTWVNYHLSSLPSRLQLIDALDKVAAWTDALSITGAIAVFQLGVFTIHQLSFHPQLNVLARTVVKSLRQFRDFFLVFIIIFITFSFMGNLLFGGQVREFSTAALSRDSCMNMLFGTFNFDTIYNIRGSGWFYWGYMTIDGYQGEINVLLASRISTIHRYLVQYPSEKDCHATKKDTSKLNHHHVIAYGKFRPPLLLEVLKTKLEHDRAYTSTTMLTPTLLRGLFPNFPISDKEMIDTFEFLRQGFVLNEAVTKQGQTKKLVSGQTKASRLAELHQILEKTHKEIQILTANETQ